MNEKPVYSTAVGILPKQTKKKDGFVRGPGPCKMRLEKRRGRKSVTILFNLPFEESEAKSLMREMQSQFACGATIKDSAIELQGDLGRRVEDFFSRKGIKLVR